MNDDNVFVRGNGVDSDFTVHLVLNRYRVVVVVEDKGLVGLGVVSVLTTVGNSNDVSVVAGVDGILFNFLFLFFFLILVAIQTLFDVLFRLMICYLLVDALNVAVIL